MHLGDLVVAQNSIWASLQWGNINRTVGDFAFGQLNCTPAQKPYWPLQTRPNPRLTSTNLFLSLFTLMTAKTMQDCEFLCIQDNFPKGTGHTKY